MAYPYLFNQNNTIPDQKYKLTAVAEIR